MLFRYNTETSAHRNLYNVTHRKLKTLLLLLLLLLLLILLLLLLLLLCFVLYCDLRISIRIVLQTGVLFRSY